MEHVSATASVGLFSHMIELEEWVAREWAWRNRGNPDLMRLMRSGDTADQHVARILRVARGPEVSNELESMGLRDILQDIGMAAAIGDIAPNVRPLVTERFRHAFDVIAKKNAGYYPGKTEEPAKRLHIVDPADLEWEQILEARADKRVLLEIV